jgi:hypothetical protein
MSLHSWLFGKFVVQMPPPSDFCGRADRTPGRSDSYPDPNFGFCAGSDAYMRYETESLCLDVMLLFPHFTLCSPCPLTRSLPLGSPFGPTFGCSISKAPPFRLWLIPLHSVSSPPRNDFAIHHFATSPAPDTKRRRADMSASQRHAHFY